MEGVNFRQQVIDEPVVLLSQLRDASIPVLWRQHHEMNRRCVWGRAHGM